MFPRGLRLTNFGRHANPRPCSLGDVDVSLRNISAIAAVVAVTALLAGPVQAGVKGFVYSDGVYNTVQFDGRDVLLYGNNDTGDLVGLYWPPGPVTSYAAFVYRNGAVSTFSAPNSGLTIPTDINNAGDVTGRYVDNGGPYGFLSTADAFQKLAVPIAFDTWAEGLNDVGKVAGFSYTATGVRGFVFDGSEYALSSSRTYLSGINNAGTVTGFTADASGFIRGFVQSAEGVSMITLGGLNFLPQDINDLGQVVGRSFAAPGAPEKGFLYDRGQFLEIVYPGAKSTFAYGINNLGQVVGFYEEAEPVIVPEPRTWAILLFGFVGAGLMLRKKAASNRAENEVATAFG